MADDLKKLLIRSEELGKIIDNEITKEEEALKNFVKLVSPSKNFDKELKERTKVNEKIKKILLDCYKKHNP